MGKLKRMLALLSVVAMLSTLVVSTAFAGTLPPDVTEDEETEWYTGPLMDMVSLGCISSDVNFNAGSYATRAETADWLACAVTENSLPAATEAPFDDVAVDHLAAGAITYLVSGGVVNGYTDDEGVATGMFGPDDLLTRDQVSKMTVLAYGLEEAGVDWPFSDDSEDWALAGTAYTWMVVTGYPDGTWGGGNNVLRAEVVAMVARAMNPTHVETGETPEEYAASIGDGDDDPEEEELAGGLTVSAMELEDMSDEVPAGATGVTVAAFEFSANEGDVEVDTVTLERSGLGDEADFDKIYLYDEDMMKIGSGKSWSSSDEQATFTSVGIDVEDGESTIVYVLVDLETTVTAGTHVISVVEVDAGDSDVTLDDASSDSWETSTIVIGAADIESSNSNNTRKVGEDGVEVADFTIEVNGIEDATVNSITLYLDGDSEIISNPNLTRGATDVGSCEVSGDYVACTDIDYEIENGETASFTLYADVDGEADDTVDIYIEDKTDVAIVGDSYGYNLTLDETIGSADSMIDELDSTPLISTVLLEAGQLTLAYNGPASDDVSENTNNVTLIDFSLTTEGAVTIEDAVFAVFGAGLLVADVEDLELVCDGTVIGQIGTLTETGGDDLDDVADVQTFDDSWSIAADTTVDCELRIDLENNMVGTTIEATIIDLGTWDIEDDNGDDIEDILPSGNIAGNTMTVAAASLTINNAGSPAAGETFVKGTDDAEMIAFVFTAGEGQDVTVSSITFDAGFDTDANGTDAEDFTGSTANTNQSGDFITGVAIWVDDVMLDQDSLTTSTTDITVTFDSLDWVIEAGTSETLVVTADVATTIAAADEVALTIASAADVTAEYGSGTDLTPTLASDNTTGLIYQTFTDTGTLTQSAYADTPDNALVADGSTDVVFTTVRLDAANEAFTVNKYAVTASDAGGLIQAGIMCADADGVANTYNQVFVGNNAEFTGLDCYVEKDETAYMYLMADIATVDSGAIDNDTTIDIIGDRGNGALTVRATGVDSGENVSDFVAAVDPQGGNCATGDGCMTVYESYPTFAAGTVGDSAIIPSLTQEVAAFTVSAGSEDITFTSGASTIEATLTQVGDGDDAIICSLVADGDTVDTPAAAANGGAIDWDFTDDTVTVPAGGSVDFTVECDTTDLATEGDVIQIVLPETEAGNGLLWDIDGDGGNYDNADVILENDLTLPALSKA